ncbi:MAG: ABC transporter substrate-binding protein [Rhodospirillales bacterium]
MTGADAENRGSIRTLRWLLFAVFLAVLCAGLGRPAPSWAAEDKPRKLTKVTLQLKWAHQFQFAGYYAALAKGYYRDRGLDVTILPAMPGDKPMESVAKGKAEFGVGTTDLLMMRAAGDPVVVLAVIYQHSPLTLMLDARSEIHNIHQLARGKIMIAPHETELSAYFAAEGLDISHMNFVDHTFDIEDLKSGRVDAMSIYSTDEPYQYAKEVGPVRLFRPIDGGVDFYGDNLFTTDDVLKKDPKMVQAFLDASLDGWRYAMKHQEEIVDLILATYGNRKARDNLLFEARQSADLVLADVVPVGFINPARWERIAQHYAGLGLLPKDMSLDGFIFQRDGTAALPAWMPKALLGATAVALLALLAGLWLAAFNQRLRREMEEREQAQGALAQRTGELEESNSQKDVLLTVIGHDIRNLFNPLLIYAQLLADPNRRLDPKTVQEYGEKLYEAGRNASEVLENLLEWALVRTGQRQTHLEVTDLGALARQTAGVYSADATLRGVTLLVEAGPPVKVLLDRHQMSTVIRNLVNNALKFTPKGGEVTVRVCHDGKDAKVVIADTGIGMDQDLVSRVLSGASADLATGAKGEIGTGVGLALCRQLVQVNDGRLNIEQNPGGGTMFTVTLAVTDAATTDAAD